MHEMQEVALRVKYFCKALFSPSSPSNTALSAHLAEDCRSEDLGLGDDVGWLVLILVRGEEGPL